uniref:CUB domain-containing protein n=1 Tax=Scylla olivacea TaxID=85551 RepID=A0A0P4WNT6_SCYOL
MTAAANVRNESDTDREATKRLEEMLGTRMDRVLAALEVQQRHTQQVLDTLNSTAMDTLAKVEEVREEMKEELGKIAEDMQMSATQTTEQPKGEEVAAVTEVAHSGLIVHNDSLPSLCSGNKILFGTVGSVEVVESNTYSSGITCSWDLNFPVESSVSLTWGYIDMENHSSCSYDWVDVKHNSKSVYGRKLCGSLNSSVLQLLNLTLHKINNLQVSFRSDGSTEKRGFRLFYRTY